MKLQDLNGWQRLGIFISTLVAVPSFLLGYEDHVYLNYDVPEQYRSLRGQEFVDSVYWDAYSKNDELKGCILSTTDVQNHVGYTEALAVGEKSSDPDSDWASAIIECDKTTSRAVFDAKWFAIVPFLVIFGFGYVVSWIVSGFRRQK